MRSVRLLCLLTLAFSVTGASAKIRVPTDNDRLQAACYPDVQRLCKDAIPDEGKITVCMEAQKASISKECTDAYEATQIN